MAKKILTVIYCSLFISVASVVSASATVETIVGSKTQFISKDTLLPSKPFLSPEEVTYINETLEFSKQKYLRGLTYLEQNDTLSTAKFFEEALTALNELVTYSGITLNEDFIDLAQTIVEDYETYIQRIDLLPTNSSVVTLRNFLFQESSDYNEAYEQEVLFNPKRKEQFTEVPKKQTVQAGPTELLVVNEHVEKNIEFLTKNNAGKRFLTDVLTRSGRWFPMYKRVAAEVGVPEEIIHLSMIESRLNPTIESPAKAVGLWQFIRSTGEMYDLKVTPWVDERRDPEKATRAGLTHLNDLYNRFGDWHLALAAYNCGPGGVRKGMRKAGLGDNASFWDIRDNLPKETRNYVPLFIATSLVVANPDQYGVDISSINYDKEYKFDTYTVREPITLAVIAKCARTTEEEIRELNTELLQGITPPNAKAYRIRIPQGSMATFAANFEKLTPEEKAPWFYHTAQKGETVQSIAKMYTLSPIELANLNELSSYKNKLQDGKDIRIPMSRIGMKGMVIAKQETLSNDNQSETTKNATQSTIFQKKNTSAGEEATTSQKQQNVTKETTKVQSKEVASKEVVSSSKKWITHVVRDGETLYSISKLYGSRITDIRTWNKLPYNSDVLKKGTEIKLEFTGIASKSTGESSKETDVATLIHTVKKGETLTKIAAKYSTSIDVLVKLNKLKSSETSVKLGQTLKVPAPVKKTSKKQGIADNKKKNPDLLEKIGNVGKNNQYVVRQGDTLYSIAKKFDTTTTIIKKVNNLSSDNVSIGQVITIQ
jgi:membrane-bound lytic murein transglycosylase D